MGLQTLKPNFPSECSSLLKTTKQPHYKHHQGSFTENNETKKSSSTHFTYSGRKCMHCVCHHGEKGSIFERGMRSATTVLSYKAGLKGALKLNTQNCSYINKGCLHHRRLHFSVDNRASLKKVYTAHSEARSSHSAVQT